MATKKKNTTAEPEEAISAEVETKSIMNDPDAEVQKTEPTGTEQTEQEKTEPTGTEQTEQEKTEPTGTEQTEQEETEPTIEEVSCPFEATVTVALAVLRKSVEPATAEMLKPVATVKQGEKVTITDIHGNSGRLSNGLWISLEYIHPLKDGNHVS